MLLYLSGATSYQIYNKQFNAGLITAGYQMQKFNFNLIQGLSQKTDIVSLSALPYSKGSAERIEETADNIRYISIENHSGKLHKFFNIKLLIKEGSKLIKENRPDFILCDSISLSHAFAALYLSRKFKIPSVAIVTDVPEVMCSGKMGFFLKLDAFFMKRFSAYILITAQMNEIVNKKQRPFMVMEGSCVTDSPVPQRDETEPSVCIYSGALWEKAAGLEYFIDGFIKADLPNFELHFYGTGELIPKIIEIEKKHPQIKYMGCITNDELTIRQSRAALMVNPRPSDQLFCKYSFPSKTFDYMASGVPVLMTKLPGIPKEYFEHVFTIDHENAEGVSEKLKEIMSQPGESLRQKGLTARAFIMKNKNNLVQTERIIDFLTALKPELQTKRIEPEAQEQQEKTNAYR